MRHRTVAKRLAALEKALAPPPRFVWSPWQEILSEDEDGLLWRLAGDQGRFALGTGAGLAAHAVLLADERERELFAAILAKADAPFGPRWAFLAREGYGLDHYFTDLCL